MTTHHNTRHATLYYRIALRGVREIDEHLERGTRHYRNRIDDDLRTVPC